MRKKTPPVSPVAAPVSHLIPGDIGRPLGQIVVNLAGYDRIAALTPKARQAEPVALVERLRRGEIVDIQHTQRVTKDGRLVNVQLVVGALLDETGSLYGISTIERIEHG